MYSKRRRVLETECSLIFRMWECGSDYVVQWDSLNTVLFVQPWKIKMMELEFWMFLMTDPCLGRNLPSDWFRAAWTRWSCFQFLPYIVGVEGLCRTVTTKSLLFVGCLEGKRWEGETTKTALGKLGRYSTWGSSIIVASIAITQFGTRLMWFVTAFANFWFDRRIKERIEFRFLKQILSVSLF